MCIRDRNTGGIDELVLIDIDEEKAKGEAMDLNHGIPYSTNKMKIKSGNYQECRDSDIVVICAGANQKEGQTRLELTKINTNIVKDIALLRASGADILATSNGYIIYTTKNKEFEIKCKNHTSDEHLLLELQTIIDLGGKVKDVIVDHPTYGSIKAELNLSSNRRCV